MAGEWKSALEMRGLEPRRIDSETHGKHIQRELISRMNAFKPQREILIICWAAYERLWYMPPHKNIDVIIDEVPPIDQFYQWNVTGHLEELSDILDIGSSTGNMAEVSARDAVELEERLLELGDDVDRLFRDFKWNLLSPYKSMFVGVEAYDRVFNQKQFSEKSSEANRVPFVSMLNPDLFEGATLLGANIQHSMVYQWLTKFHESKFVEHGRIKSRLQPAVSNGHRLKLYYFFDGDVRSSRYRFNGESDQGDLLIDEMDRRAIELFGSEKFLYATNNLRECEALSQLGHAERIPVETRGLNSYSAFDNIYISFALNRTPSHIKLLNGLGLSSDVIYRATTCEQGYQSVCRTSLRDRKAQGDVKALLPDFTMASYTAEHFPGATLIKLPLSYVPKPNPFTPTEKKQRDSAKKARNAITASKRVPESLLLKEFGRALEEEQHQQTAPQGRGALASLAQNETSNTDQVDPEGRPPTCYVTLHDRKTDCTADAHDSLAMSPMDFVAYLRTQAKCRRDSKEDRRMYNPAVYLRPPGGYGWRTIANYQASSMLVLDFDNGDVSPEQFTSTFGRDVSPQRRLNFAIYNSFSRSPQEPNCFHVVVFFREPARSVEEHKAVFDTIVRRLEEERFSRDRMELDDCSGVQSFYIPCTNRAHPEMAFFESHGVTARDLTKAISPKLCMKTAIQNEPWRLFSGIADVLPSPSAIEEVLSPYRGMKEDRHKPIFDACRRLRLLGLSHAEIEARITQTFGSEPKVMKKTKNDLRSIDRYLGRFPSMPTGSANTTPGN